MADLPQQTTIKQYLSSGSAGPYNTGFYVPLNPQTGEPALDVYVTPAGQTPIPASDIVHWDVDYTFTPYGDPINLGGYVTFIAGHLPSNGDTITLARNIPASLDTEFVEVRTINGQTLDDAFGRLLLITQQNKTYALNRNLSYIVNAELPTTEADIQLYTQLGVLGPNQIWMGSNTAGGGVIVVTLEQPADVSTLRSELANDSPSTNGAGLVGYYNTVTSAPTTVKDMLGTINDEIVALQADVTARLPSGTILDFGGTSVPAGFLACDGASYLRSAYPNLFTAIGTTWGAADGTHFNVPDFRRRTAVGSGGSGTGTLGNAVGNTGGSETHTLTSAELPDPLTTGSGTAQVNNVSPIPDVIDNTAASGSGTISNPGGNQPHNIMQPSAVVLKIIKT